MVQMLIVEEMMTLPAMMVPRRPRPFMRGPPACNLLQTAGSPVHVRILPLSIPLPSTSPHDRLHLIHPPGNVHPELLLVKLSVMLSRVLGAGI